MTDILIIARRELMQYVRTRGFVLTLLFIPAWILLAGLLHRGSPETEPPRPFAVIDKAGGFTAAIDRSLVAEMSQAHAGKKRYTLRRVEAPDDLASAAETGDKRILASYLRGERPVFSGDGPVALFALAVIPKNFSAQHPDIDYWSANQTDPVVEDFLRHALADELRAQALGKAGIDAKTLDGILAISVGVAHFDPAIAAASGEVTSLDRLRIQFPFAIAVLMLLAILSIASTLLMAVIEEKSSRVIEMILASISPGRLMAGKLIGAAGAAVIMMAGWTLGGSGAATIVSATTPFQTIEALAAAHALDDAPAMALCFFCGLAIHTTIFLGVGAMARSFQEAQSFLGPLMLLMFGPLGFLLTVLKEPNGFLATLLSFSPLHAPFFLMVRLPQHPPLATTLLAFLWMVISTVGLVRLMVYGFARNILRTDRSPRLMLAFSRLTGRRAKT